MRTIVANADEAKKQLEAARAELKELREKPVDVAVMAVDQAALDRAREAAISEMQAKVDKATEGKKKAEETRKALEDELAAARKQLEEATWAEKKAVLSGDKDLDMFDLVLSQAQENLNRLHGMVLKVQGRGDEEMSGKLKRALAAFAESARRCAE